MATEARSAFKTDVDNNIADFDANVPADVRGELKDLADSALFLQEDDSITGQPQFAPGSAQAPFTLNANAQQQTVTGLRADELPASYIGTGISGGDGTNLSLDESVLKDGGAKELDLADLAGGLGTNGQVPQSDGAAVTWVTLPHDDLTSVGADDHHAQDQSPNYKDGGTFEIDAAEFAAALGTSGQVLQSDGAAGNWVTLASGDLSDFDEAAQDAVGNNVDSTLTYDDATPSFGINLGNANTWTADQTFSAHAIVTEQGADPGSGTLGDGEATLYTSDGTADATGADRDVILAGSNGTTVKTLTLLDYSAGGVPNSALVNNSVTYTAGTGLSGGGAVSLGQSATINLSAATSDLTDAASPNATAAGQLLIWDATDGQFENATLTEGNGNTITNADASITIAVDPDTGISTSASGVALDESYGATITSAWTWNTGAAADLSIDETGLNFSTSNAETVNVQNKGTGSVTLQQDGTAVVLETRSLTGGNAIDAIGDLSSDRTIAVSTDGIGSDELDRSVGYTWNAAHTWNPGTDSASVQAGVFQNLRATPSDNDEAFLSFELNDGGSNATEAARMTWKLTDVTDTSEDSEWAVSTLNAGTLSEELIVGNDGTTTVANGQTNSLQFAGAASGNAPTLSAVGGDAKIDILIQPKGNGVVNFRDSGGAGTAIHINGNKTLTSFSNDLLVDSPGFVSLRPNGGNEVLRATSGEKILIGKTSHSADLAEIAGTLRVEQGPGAGTAIMYRAVDTDTSDEWRLQLDGSGRFVQQVHDNSAATTRDVFRIDPSQAAQLDVLGVLNLTDGSNIPVGTTNGTQLATATDQKLGLWGTTPITQPDTSHGASSFTQNSGTTVNDASTFNGYTLKQIAQALDDLGVLT